ncbi:MAG: phage/plasmid primase, P4 family [Gemmobacter sp.]
MTAEDEDDPFGALAPVDPAPALPADAEAIVAACAALPLNDVGNGQRFVAHFGADCLWVPRVGWYVWDGMRWKADPDALQVRNLAHRMGALIAAEVRHLPIGGGLPPDRDEIALILGLPKAERSPDQRVWADAASARYRQARAIGNSGPITNMLAEASILLRCDLEALDADPLAINCLSGVLRFDVEGGPGTGFSRTASVTLGPHDRALRITKLMPVHWAGHAAPAPRWTAFLARVQPDSRMRAFLQRWCGLGLTALSGEQKLVFHYGGGANGKSVFAEAIARIMGDYAAKAKIESLTGKGRRGGGDATPDLVPLIGARAVRASEPDQGTQLQEGLIKELTGGEPILVRALHTNFVEVTPFFKLSLVGNHKPEVRGADDGIWRRLLLVPWDVQIPPDERDRGLIGTLAAEGDGIFAWAVEGLIAYLEGGLDEPETVIEATREYREDSDPVGSFLVQACLVTGEAADVLPARELVEAFNFWMADRGESEWRARTIQLRLKEKAGRWKSAETGRSFAAGLRQGRSTYTGVRFNDLFGRAFRSAPRDAHGRIIGRAGGWDQPGTTQGGAGDDALV